MAGAGPAPRRIELAVLNEAMKRLTHQDEGVEQFVIIPETSSCFFFRICTA